MERYSFRPSGEAAAYDDVPRETNTTPDDAFDDYDEAQDADFANEIADTPDYSPSAPEIVDAEYEDVLELDEELIVVAPDKPDKADSEPLETIDIPDEIEAQAETDIGDHEGVRLSDIPNIVPPEIVTGPDPLSAPPIAPSLDVSFEENAREPLQDTDNVQVSQPAVPQSAAKPDDFDNGHNVPETVHKDVEPGPSDGEPPRIDTSQPSDETRRQANEKIAELDADFHPSDRISHPLRDSGSLEELLNRLQAASNIADNRPGDRPGDRPSDRPSDKADTDVSDPPVQKTATRNKPDPILSDRLQAALDRLERARKQN